MNAAKLTATFAVVASLCLSVSFSLEARPKDPRRERARCDSAQRLCKDVAGIDYRNCVKAGQSGCANDYNEDVGQCNTDHQSCVDKI